MRRAEIRHRRAYVGSETRLSRQAGGKLTLTAGDDIGSSSRNGPDRIPVHNQHAYAKGPAASRRTTADGAGEAVGVRRGTPGRTHQHDRFDSAAACRVIFKYVAWKPKSKLPFRRSNCEVDLACACPLGSEDALLDFGPSQTTLRQLPARTNCAYPVAPPLAAHSHSLLPLSFDFVKPRTQLPVTGAGRHPLKQLPPDREKIR